MTTIRAFVKRHPLLSFYALVFAIAWGGILILAGGPSGIPTTEEQFEMLMPWLMLVWLAGPSVAGIVLTGLVYGREGFRNLFARMRRWRVGARWYAVALLTAPLLYVGVSLVLSLTSPEYRPGILATSDKATLLLFGIGWGLIGGGLLEELGWTGFATPTLLRRYGVLGTGLTVGVLWGVFHWPVNGWAGVTLAGALSVAISLPLQLLFFTVAGLTAYRVLMVWVYERTGESLLLAILMHASLTASMIILSPVVTGVAYLTYNLVLTAALWVVVGAVAVASGGHLTRQPLRRRVA
ncbi:MAG TPA: CPBP family glutamic-type intramembrane protease [Rubrobacter sp.]|nr:CPBP family glutamic-type intramembrane protease [Rubrobacter sp.]